MFKKSFFALIVLLLLISRKEYAIEKYNISDFENVYNWGIYSNQNSTFSFNKNLDLSNTKIKMIQDDKYYTFDISAIASINENVKNKIRYEEKGNGKTEKGYGKNYGWNGYYKAGDDGVIPNSIGECYSLVKNRLMPIAYKKKNFTNNEIIWYSDFSISNGGCIWDIYNGLFIGPDKVSEMIYHHIISETWSEASRKCTYETIENNFFMKYPIKEIEPFYGFTLPTYNPKTGKNDLSWTADTLLKKHDGFELLSNSCTLNNYTLDEDGYISTAEYNLKAKIKIEKDLFLEYRYFAFAGLNFITDFTYCNDYVSRYKGIFSSTDTIDLNEYVVCDHNWEYSNTENNSKHTMCCKKCNWTKTVAHNYKYEYDGMTNNLCECGRNKKVKYTFVIDDDNVKEEIKTFDTYSKYEKIIATRKKGYTLKNYEKYEMQIKDKSFSTTQTKINIVKQTVDNILDEKTANYSVKYIANWEPNKYTFVYNNKNNLSIVLPETLSNQEFVYDKEQKIREGQKLIGYKFKGWTTIENSNVVEFFEGDLVNNYTDVNNAIITLFPVYEENEYKIKYSNYNAYNKKIKKLPEQTVKYSAQIKLEKAEEIKGYKFNGWSKEKDSSKVEYKNEEEVSKMSSEENATIILYPIYEPIKYTIVYSKINNINKNVYTIIENQNCVYDKEEKIKSGIDIEKYKFLGWSRKKYSDEVEFLSNEKILNYTDIDELKVILYPVYQIKNIRINYNTINGEYSDGKNTAIQDVLYDDNKKLIFPHNYNGVELYFTHYSCDLDNTKKFKDMKSVKKYMYDQKTTEIILNASFEKIAIGNAERTADGLSPQATGGFRNSKNKILVNNNVDIESIDKNIKSEEEENIKKETSNKKEKEGKEGKEGKEEKDEEIDIEIFDMAKSEWQKIYEILGIKIATFSTIMEKGKYEIYGNKYMIKVISYMLKYKKHILLSMIIIVLASIVIALKKRR